MSVMSEQDGISSLARYAKHQVLCCFPREAGQEDSASSWAAADTYLCATHNVWLALNECPAVPLVWTQPYKTTLTLSASKAGTESALAVCRIP